MATRESRHAYLYIEQRVFVFPILVEGVLSHQSKTNLGKLLTISTVCTLTFITDNRRSRIYLGFVI